MRICRFAHDNGQDHLGVIDEGGRIVDGGPWSEYTLGHGGRSIESVDISPKGGTIPMGDVELLAPVTPRKIVCVGLNYRSHAEEAGITDIPDKPMVFGVLPNAVVGPGEAVRIPAWSEQIDYEGELAVIIGRRSKNVSISEAEYCVLGYTIANDVSARDYQMKGNWIFGKSADTFLPIGPVVVTPEEVKLDDLILTTRVNGEVRQQESVGNMLHDVADLISHISSALTLDPGDVICTGTPAGVGFATKQWLSSGDTVSVEISRIGKLENVFI